MIIIKFTSCHIPQFYGADGADKIIIRNGGTFSGNGGGTFFVSSFFIGLSFCSGLFAGSVAAPIQSFLSRVNIWDGKKDGMGVIITVS